MAEVRDQEKEQAQHLEQQLSQQKRQVEAVKADQQRQSEIDRIQGIKAKNEL